MHLRLSALAAILTAFTVPLRAQLVDPTKQKETVKPAAPVAAPAGPVVKARQSTVYGLLVMELGEGKLAGQASQMNCTAVQGGVDPAVLKFNQDVGKEMEGALNEVKKFMSV